MVLLITWLSGRLVVLLAKLDVFSHIN